MNNKKTILTFIGYYLPGYKSGGPVRTISNMLNILKDYYNFKIITKDCDQLDTKPYDGIKINDWNSVNGNQVYYSNHKVKLRKTIRETNFDIYYLNSCFSYEFSIKIMLLRRLKLIPQKEVLLAPRGEFSKGALSLKSIKKRTFLILAKTLRLHNNITWHASSEYEADDIRRVFGNKVRIKIAVDVPECNIRQVKRKEKKEGELKILYIAGITRIKNLRFVFEVLKKVKGNYSLDIFGPIKDVSYWNKCQQILTPAMKSRITYKGPIHHSLIHKVYPEYDIFFFPTLGENFGHVIYESLAYNTPVLTSDNTLWEKLEEHNAGWNFSLKQPEKYIDVIEDLIKTDPVTYNKYFTGCNTYLNLFWCKHTPTEANINLFS